MRCHRKSNQAVSPEVAGCLWLTLVAVPFKAAIQQPGNSRDRRLKGLERDEELSGRLYHQLRPSGSQPPRIYGLLKIHKAEVHLRTIASCIGATSYQLSKHIASLISPLAGKTDLHVRNSKHFVEVMADLRVEEDEMLVSFMCPPCSPTSQLAKQFKSFVTDCEGRKRW